MFKELQVGATRHCLLIIFKPWSEVISLVLIAVFLRGLTYYTGWAWHFDEGSVPFYTLFAYMQTTGYVNHDVWHREAADYVKKLSKPHKSEGRPVAKMGKTYVTNLVQKQYC